mmetsp:Transcript_32903/g.75772  ORF Transcript_32903/g.75772 Transcript_32903/m.75772 type:complete len:275 (-) Transcript_32903:509-1333(-)
MDTCVLLINTTNETCSQRILRKLLYGMGFRVVTDQSPLFGRWTEMMASSNPSDLASKSIDEKPIQKTIYMCKGSQSISWSNLYGPLLGGSLSSEFLLAFSPPLPDPREHLLLLVVVLAIVIPLLTTTRDHPLVLWVLTNRPPWQTCCRHSPMGHHGVGLPSPDPRHLPHLRRFPCLSMGVPWGTPRHLHVVCCNPNHFRVLSWQCPVVKEQPVRYPPMSFHLVSLVPPNHTRRQKWKSPWWMLWFVANYRHFFPYDCCCCHVQPWVPEKILPIL